MRAIERVGLGKCVLHEGAGRLSLVRIEFGLVARSEGIGQLGPYRAGGIVGKFRYWIVSQTRQRP